MKKIFGGAGAQAGRAESGRRLVPGDGRGRVPRPFCSCVQELFQAARANTQNIFCPCRSPDLTFERSPRDGGEGACAFNHQRRNRGAAITRLERKFSDDANEKKAGWSPAFEGRMREAESQALNSRRIPRQCHEVWLGRWRAHRACSKTRPVREEVRASLSSRGWNREGTAPQRRRRRLTKRGSAAAGNGHHPGAFLDARRVAVSLFVFMRFVFLSTSYRRNGTRVITQAREGAANRLAGESGAYERRRERAGSVLKHRKEAA